MRFEEHDNQLFRILEEPVPLTDDTELPVLVRMIHDDTMIGKANKRICHQNELAQKIICINITDSLFINYAYRYEIIGLPVADGSKEWALYQLMKGIFVRHDEGKPLHLDGDYIYCGKIAVCHIIDFLSKASPTGWRIYEPEQPKPKYRVGDSVICEYHRSPLPKQVSYERIIDINDVTIVTQSQNGSVCEYDINGNHGDINGWHIDRVISPSEHIVTIGCLSGTVRPMSTNGTHIWFHLIGVDDRIIATIRISSLDTQTRELVESLLKTQEEQERNKDD